MLGEQIKKHRNRCLMTQGDLATKADIAIDAVRGIERNAGNLQSLQVVLRCLNLQISGLPKASSIGEQVKLLRTRRKHSLRYLAEQIGLSTPTLMNLEKGKGRMASFYRVITHYNAKIFVRDLKRTHFQKGETDVWNTSQEFLDKIHSVVPEFCLDPATNPTSLVNAKVHFYESHDGLKQNWHGQYVYLNPPYSTLPEWVAKAYEEYQCGNAKTIIALLPVRSNTDYFHSQIASYADVLFIKKRLKFGQSQQQAPFASMLVCWTKSNIVDQFARVIDGTILRKQDGAIAPNAYMIPNYLPDEPFSISKPKRVYGSFLTPEKIKKIGVDMTGFRYGKEKAITDYHAKYFSHELSRRHSASDSEKIATALFDAQVDLNPHQVSAALFAFKSPLSKGAILADEVGLGKTIEGGLVLSQKWAEGKRRILIICPASLRKQWVQELSDKFFLPSTILEAKNYNKMIKDGVRRPFERDDIGICSFQFAARHEEELMVIPWDLVIIDEAHRLRNVYKTSNKTGRVLRAALSNAPKILLTATPLQNSLMELYGLVSFIDEYAFGDAKSFRSQYARLTGEDSFNELKARLAPICHRTLRRQVMEYIRYTNRIAITEEFTPSEEEQTLYDLVSDYLRRDNLQALPSSQRTLMTLILRKLLASSTFAIAGALEALARKLRQQLKDNADLESTLAKLENDIAEDFEAFEELTDEWSDDDEQPEPLTQAQIDAIDAEIADLEAFKDLAVSIAENAKGQALLSALETGFNKAKELEAADKAIIFTESRRTQDYLVRILEENGYKDQIVLFNGSNTDPKSKEVYKQWVEDNKGSDKISGSRTADMRAALVDEFRDNARIMIATEAAAEGINLQFCSMLVNYDLPWNPQRVEQRIGRCHRYGQQHDVVVINFLNKSNAADQRVYQLLDEKFKLFSGVFGASDEVLGAIEGGVDFEKRIAAIYQNCRTTDDIETAFNELRNEMEDSISATMDDTRKQLLENFDAEVHDKLRVNLNESKEYLNRYEAMLWQLTAHELHPYAAFDDKTHSFTVHQLPEQVQGTTPTGRYELSKTPENAHRYRLGHPLAQWVLTSSQERSTPPAELVLDYGAWSQTAQQIEGLVGQSGTIAVGKLSITGSDAQDHMLFAGTTDDGTDLTPDQIRRLLQVPATVADCDIHIDDTILTTALETRKKAILEEVEAHRAEWFDEEMEKLDHWAEDKRKALKVELKDVDDQIKDLKKRTRLSGNLQEKLGLQRQTKKLESKRDEAWRAYDGQARVIEKQKDNLLDEVEERLQQDVTDEVLFSVRWRM